MRFPRVRLTTRRAMLLVALAAFALILWQDGWPPRFVVNGIPARLERLRPGMTPEEVDAILRPTRSWLLSGLSATHYLGKGNGNRYSVGYRLGLARGETARTASGRAYNQPPHIVLDFDGGGEGDPNSRLTIARFHIGGRVIAEMPRPTIAR